MYLQTYLPIVVGRQFDGVSYVYQIFSQNFMTFISWAESEIYDGTQMQMQMQMHMQI